MQQKVCDISYILKVFDSYFFFYYSFFDKWNNKKGKVGAKNV